MVRRASDRFLKEIQGSHRVYSYVEAIAPGGPITRLRIFSGSVNVDRTAQYRRAAAMSCVDPSGKLTPAAAAGLLTPFGTEIRPYRGVMYADGTTEVVPLGVFRLAESDVAESASMGNAGGGSYTGVSIDLQMYDRSRTISRDKFTSPWSIPVGTNLVVAIKQILGRTFSDLQYDATDTSSVTTSPQVLNIGDDPWQQATALASSIGSELYFDASGRAVIAPSPDTTALGAPDYTYVEGQNNTMTDLSAAYSDDPGFNGVIVTGASIGDNSVPVIGTAWDTNPSSPTYYLGPYGKVPMFVSDQNVSTAAQAQSVATATLGGILGFSAQLVVGASVNPSYEAGDTVRVVRSPMNISGLYLIDAFTVPLGGQISGVSQSLTLRQKQG